MFSCFAGKNFASFAKSYYLLYFFPQKIGVAVLESSPNLTSIVEHEKFYNLRPVLGHKGLYIPFQPTLHSEWQKLLEF